MRSNHPMKPLRLGIFRPIIQYFRLFNAGLCTVSMGLALQNAGRGAEFQEKQPLRSGLLPHAQACK